MDSGKWVVEQVRERFRELGLKPSVDEFVGFAEDRVLRNNKAGRARLDEKIDEVLRYVQGPRSRHPSLADRLEPVKAPTSRERGRLQPLEWLRARVVALALLRRANADPAVIDFRRTYLTGRVVPIDEAIERFKALPARDLATAEPALDALCQRLSRRFGWDEIYATTFVVTGQAPPTPPVQLRVIAQCVSDDYTAVRIVLEIESWVSPSTVESIYRESQRTLRGSAHQPLGDLALKRFTLVDRARMRGEEWPAIYAGMRPTVRPKGGWRNLWRDVVLRTGRALLHPRLALSMDARAEGIARRGGLVIRDDQVTYKGTSAALSKREMAEIQRIIETAASRS